LTAKIRSNVVDLEHRLIAVCRARVVDDDVGFAVGLDASGDEGVDIRAFGYIAPNEVGVVADFLRERFTARRIEIGDHHARAFGDIHAHDAFSKSLCSARDDGDLSFKLVHVEFPPMRIG
jgi:hypothetical protein